MEGEIEEKLPERKIQDIIAKALKENGYDIQFGHKAVYARDKNSDEGIRITISLAKQLFSEH